MRPVLHDIVERKRRDVAARKHALDPRPASGRAGVFRAALARPGARFILEAKRRSPSLGDLRPALDAATIVSAYSGIADAISVVTDEPFFGGSLELLAEVRARCTLPLLCKDFVVDPYQVGEAAHHGADAILLMMSVLDDGDARACLAEAERHGLDALVEVHDEIELGRALALGASIVGINHRSFRDLSIDLTLSGRLAPRIPAGVVVIAESGIAGASDVDRIAPHVDAFLVGSLLMKEPDLRGAAAALVFGRVKICGLTNAADAVLAARSGAAQLGLVFADGARRVTPAEARAIAIAASRPVVGVFRDQTVEVIVATVRDLGLAGVQLHGSESDASVLQLRRELPPGVFVTRAIAVDVDGGAAVVADLPHADRLLFDARVDGASGGTGKAFAWDRLAAHPRLQDAWIGGGLRPENARAARALGCHGLDVSSGVEGDTRGRKSPERMAAFFQALRAPARTEVAR